MIIYTDVISGDEMFSDSFKVISDNDIFYEVEGKAVTRTDGFDDSLISANASAEEAAEGADSASVSGVDIILNHKLQETVFAKKTYVAYIKSYVKAIKAQLEKTNPSRVEAFVLSSQTEVAKVVGKFGNYQFFTGETMNPGWHGGTAGLPC
ncbi:translationally-controlled tumor protein homolog [Cottoperca gobio]|uniref:Translationally-controlled tumor protein homolog n=1 Tax=Cottoperca gobio TaxID=56716 RepID=A0A6J2S0I0_COTGO|nr:translationally-controlled tumor protein [Cottoperca gobio]